MADRSDSKRGLSHRLVKAALALALPIATSMTLAPPTQAQILQTLYSFTGGAVDQADPQGSVLLLGNSLYATSSSPSGALVQVDLATGLETTLHTFGASGDGANPSGALIQCLGDDICGTTASGGAYGQGTIFALNSSGALTLLHSFNGTDGANPAGGVLLDSHGNFYGVTQYGGKINAACGSGCGTVFKLNPAGTLTTLHSFSGEHDGLAPKGSLLLLNGSLYGTTSSSMLASNYGTIFKLALKTGKTTVLHTFTGGADGAYPYSGVIADSNGNLYGTATDGGSGSAGSGDGVVYKLNIATGAETVLHTFTGTDGANPKSALAMNFLGDLFGTTFSAGGDGYGTVFRLDPAGNFTTFYNFSSVGGSPVAGLVLDSNDNLYGTGSGSPGAEFYYGTLFEILPLPDYAISPSPTTETVPQGSQAVFVITADFAESFVGPVSNFTVSNLPPGATATFSTSEITYSSGTAAIFVDTSASTPVGRDQLTIGTSGGGVNMTATVQLVVTAATGASPP